MVLQCPCSYDIENSRSPIETLGTQNLKLKNMAQTLSAHQYPIASLRHVAPSQSCKVREETYSMGIEPCNNFIHPRSFFVFLCFAPRKNGVNLPPPFFDSTRGNLTILLLRAKFPDSVFSLLFFLCSVTKRARRQGKIKHGISFVEAGG